MTMKVDAIDSNNKRRGCIIPMMQGAAIGATGGFVLKYAQPLNAEEKGTPEYKSTIRDIEKKRTSYTSWTESYLDKMRKKGHLSLAEDVFIKTYDGMKEGEKVGASRIIKSFSIIKNQRPEEVGELRRIFNEAKFEANSVAQKYVNLYNLATKHFRPTAFFLATGAVTGALIALIQDVLRTDVKNS